MTEEDSVSCTSSGSSDDSLKILMLGLDNAGKTVMLYQWKLGEVISSASTIGFIVETIRHPVKESDIALSIWEIGGKAPMRKLIKHYLHDTEGIIIAIDKTQPERLSELETTILSQLTAPEVAKCPMLFVINKQDASTDEAVTEESVRNLDFVKEEENKRIIVVARTSATTGEGMKEAMDLFADALVKSKQL